MSTDRVEVLFAGAPGDWDTYGAHLQAALDAAGIAARLSQTCDRPEAVDYIVYSPGGDLSDFTPFTGLRAVLSLWAGVETIVTNPTLTQPLCRLVDPGLTEGMVEWVCGHVLRHHLGMDRHVLGQDGQWRAGTAAPLARDRRVSVFGLGALGMAAANALAGLNFDVAGWSRGAKTADFPTHTGAEALHTALARTDIAVLLLPLTAATEGVIDAAALAALPRDAVLINPGRGALIDDAALLAALDTGHLAHATLDVFRTEPLPPDHRFWTHPKVTVTPHIAAMSRPTSATRAIAENIRRGQAGLPLLHLVDRARGY